MRNCERCGNPLADMELIDDECETCVSIQRLDTAIQRLKRERARLKAVKKAAVEMRDRCDRALRSPPRTKESIRQRVQPAIEDFDAAMEGKA